MIDDAPAADRPAGAAPTRIPLQARRDLREAFAYLQAPQRADYYQAIVRVFLRNARQYYRIYLTMEDLSLEIAALYGDYTVEKCRADLDQLALWGNVVKTFDTAQRYLTIESFLNPTVLYRATAETLAIEDTFLQLERQTETVGELRQGDLDHLLALFAAVDRLVHGRPSDDELTSDLSPDEVLAETWRSLADQARAILDNTSKYIHTLAVARQEAASTEIEGYLRYKQQVVTYVQRFATALNRVSIQLQRYFRSWEADGSGERILTVLAEHSVVPHLQTSALDERIGEAASQMAAVADWFRGPDWAEYFGKAARHEINAVLQRAQLLTVTSRLGAGYLSDLETLARDLLGMDSAERAAQITAVALGHVTPRLLPEHQAGGPDLVGDSWDGPAAVPIELRPIQRGSSLFASESAAIQRDGMAQIQREIVLAFRRERVERIDRLFGSGEQPIDQLVLTGDEDARLILEVIRRCLGDASRRWRAEDGSMITLLNPAERRLTVLRSPAAGYILPRYHLQRTRHALSA